MKILVIGASANASIGKLIGDQLKQNGHEISYASRSGRLGLICDTTTPKQVIDLLSRQKPEIIIHAAGVFSKPNKLGAINDWENIKYHFLAKSLGALAVVNAATRCRNVKKIIMLGGRKISSAEKFASYTIANGALWSLVEFTARHTAMEIYYLDLPLVSNSAMSSLYLSTLPKAEKKSLSEQQIPADKIIRVIQRIIAGKYKNGSRIILGNKAQTL